MPTIDILGIPHTYELTTSPIQPSTPVLIFIHGWLLSRNYWQPLINQLSVNYPCLVYDLKGFGDSQAISAINCRNSAIKKTNLLSATSKIKLNQSPYTLAAYAQDLQILLQKLEIENAWLIGHSLGGSIALWGADTCANKVKGVICLNAGGGIYLKEEFERFRTAGQQLVQRRPRWLLSLPLIDLLFARIMVARPLCRSWGRQRLLDFLNADTEAALGSLLDSTTEAEVHLLPQIVSRLQQPVYFIAGEKDRVMEPKYVRHLASFHQMFEIQDNVIEIPDCGHLSMVEHPKLVGEKILKILQRHD